MNHSFKTVANSLAWVMLFAAAFPAIGISLPNAQGQDAEEVSPDKVNPAETSEDEIEEPPYEPLTKSELQKSLTTIQYKVTQNEETEPAYRNKYWNNKKAGLYRCVVCGQSLFSSKTKYKSGTGWPSFYDPIKKENVGFKADFHFFYPRKEVHCSRCKAHLGHVFDDGPKDKTGKRYCMNSASLKFEPESEEEKPQTKKPKTDESASASASSDD